MGINLDVRQEGGGGGGGESAKMEIQWFCQISLQITISQKVKEGGRLKYTG